MAITQDIQDEIKVFNHITEKNKKVRLDVEGYQKMYSRAGVNLNGTGKSLLEIGCSEGVHCNALQHAGYTVTGIDISDKAIEKAKVLFPNIKFMVMPAQKLEFQDGTFDVTLFWLTLHHFYYSNLEDILSEAIRVTKPGGLVVVCEPNNFYLYNYVAYTLAHFIRLNFNIAYINETFTVNEHSLNPYKLEKICKEKSQIESLRFFDYHTALSESEDCPRPKLLGKVRIIMDRVSKFLPEKYKYDLFSLILKVKS